MEEKHHFIIGFCELVAGFSVARGGFTTFFGPSAERPLHHSEKILEQVLEWSSLESPGSAFLVLKKFPLVESRGIKPTTPPLSHEGLSLECFIN